MNDTKMVVAVNLTQLRKSRGLTQAQLADEFSYSDKAICRWEHGDTMPDINTLCALADFYGVTMNDLVDPEFEVDKANERTGNVFKYRIFISIMLVAVVWLFATVSFTTTMTLLKEVYWLAFVWAVPVSCFTLARFWRKSMSHILKVIIYSVMVWSVIASIFLHLLIVNGVNGWAFFLIGVPLEFIVVFWQQIKYYKNNL